MVKTIVCSFGLACVLTAIVSAEPAPPSQQIGRPLERVALLERFFAPDENPLFQYRALRRLTASTRGGHLSATMDAWTTLDPTHGFTFQVVSESGSPLIRRKVLLAALEAEQQSHTVADHDEAALTTANYQFQDASAATPHLVKVDLQPRRKHVMRVNGSIFLDDESADLVRIEGELSKRPSFWTRRVQIQREYSRIDGVHVPVAMRSTADVLVVGASNFSMTYAYAEINGRPIPH